MIKSLIKSTLQELRCLRLRQVGVKIGSPRHLSAGIDCRPGYGAAGRGDINIGDGAWLEQGVVLHAFGGTIRLGRDVFLGPYAVVYGHGGVEIGDACLISMHCRILSSNHTIAPFGTDMRSQPDVLLHTKIGRDVWLGAGVTILGGVKLGEGCIIGAGSVVTKDIPPGAIAFGSPAMIKDFRDRSPQPV
ncbi:MAG: acyltransferase [Opitutaceae bacterium]|nr:acyltransferase [Opitutaceae bacterium]